MNIYKQAGEYDCFLACLATATQKAYWDLWPMDFRQEVEAAKGTYGENLDRAFEICGLVKNTDYWCVCIPQDWVSSWSLRQLLNGRRAILQVPSLNHAKAQHGVYWSGDTLYDPSNKQIYQWLEQCAPAYIWIFNEVK